ncbi:virB8 family protein [Methylocystis echinoides]|uniref:virB8 family protein n=1 Tax=Methylocystis echinoides TaxID=29468 RepID=UPI00343E6289
MVEAGDLKTYFERARLWEQDLLLAAQRSQRIAWGVAAAASLLAFASIGAVAALTPLKTVEPFVIRVDNATGIVDVVSAVKDEPQTYDEAIARYFLAQYVRVREGYSFVEAPSNFRTVSLLSTQTEQERFAHLYRGSNPESPQAAYGRSGLAEIRIKAISLLGPTLASVRYLREVRHGDETKLSHWIATVTFSFEKKATISSSDRLINPLGFLVSEYRSDPETAP